MTERNVKGINQDDTVYEDPSFVVVGISRISVNPPRRIFGSDATHSNLMSLRIQRASQHRNKKLSSDHSFAEERLIEVWMTPSQFAEMITTPNVGDGVPATLTQLLDEHFETPKMPSRADLFKQEISGRLVKIEKELAAAHRLAAKIVESKAPLKAADRDELKSSLSHVHGLFAGYMPFIIEQFGKTLNKMTTEAKADVDAFVTAAIHKTGLESIRQNAPQLEDDDKG